MTKIEWNPPEPRTGMLGAWDKFVGPVRVLPKVSVPCEVLKRGLHLLLGE